VVFFTKKRHFHFPQLVANVTANHLPFYISSHCFTAIDEEIISASAPCVQYACVYACVLVCVCMYICVWGGSDFLHPLTNNSSFITSQ